MEEKNPVIPYTPLLLRSLTLILEDRQDKDCQYHFAAKQTENPRGDYPIPEITQLEMVEQRIQTQVCLMLKPVSSSTRPCFSHNYPLRQMGY